MGASRLPASRRRSGTLRLALRRRKVAEISTIQDQITLLKQIGYLPEDVCAAQPCPAAAVAPAQDVRQARTGTSYASPSGRLGGQGGPYGPPPGTNTAAFFACAEGILRVRLSETDADARASRSNCVMRRPASTHVPPGLKASRPGNASARAGRQLVSVMTGMVGKRVHMVAECARRALRYLQ